MVLTPLDIHNKSFKKKFKGYNEEEVDEFLDKVVDNYEQTYKENMDLKDEIEKYKAEIEKYEKIEETLHNSLILAQQTAEEVKKSAEDKSNLMIREAEIKSEAIIFDANKKVDEAYAKYTQLVEKVKLFKIRYKSFLQVQIDSLDEEQEMVDNNRENDNNE